MIKNYIKIALRNLVKYKGYSFINISGLAIGIACSVLISLFVIYELSFDRFHDKADRIYRIAVRALIGDTKIRQTASSSLTFKKLLEEFPEIEKGIKFLRFGRVPVKLLDKTFYEPKFYAVDSTFFEIFSFPLISGNPETVLVEPNTMVISRDTAIKYFGHTDVVGKILKADFSSRDKGIRDFKITGISENVPNNSHFYFQILVSSATFPSYINDQGWSSNRFITYLLLKKGTSEKTFNEKLKVFTRKYMGGERYDAWVAKGNYWEYYLQPITEIHLNSDLNGEFEANGNATYVYIFSIVSIIILLIACTNFMNLSTAKASLRAKEVGLRKVVGSSRGKLINQFLSESVIMSFFSMLIGIGIIWILLPHYGDLVDRQLNLHFFNIVIVIFALIALSLLVGLVSGSYPAFFLSSFKPTTVLKGTAHKGKGGSLFRNILVIIQFSISIFLIISTITVYQQLRLFQNKRLGFNKEQVLVINNPGSLKKNLAPFKQILRKNPSVLKVSGSTTLPGRGFSNIGFGAEGVEKSFTLNICICDYEYLKTLKLKLAQGRFFSRDFTTDSHAVVINEKAARLLGWDNPIDKRINNWYKKRGNFTVIGVVKDYHYESLHQEIRPMALFLSGGYYKWTEGCISVRLNTENIPGTIKQIHNIWNRFATGAPFEYSFLDDDYDNLYKNEQQTRILFIIFSILAISLACLGLFGLASFMADRRTKEIGIRKVLGASIPGIVTILNKGFLKLVLVANLLAWPTAWLIMNNWLQNFAYRINLAWWMFIIAAATAFLIALTIISLQTIKAALKNPIDSLRYE
jgi:putative ABC transport system permease protein